jgi:NitT/TauT family transport system substrate-binding protein
MGVEGIICKLADAAGGNRMRRRAFLGAGAALGVGLALPKRLRADAGLVPVRFAVNFTYQGIHAMWVLEPQRGLFAAEGLEVLMNRGYGSGDTILKVASGAYDIGFADVNGIIKFNTEQPDQRLIDRVATWTRSAALPPPPCSTCLPWACLASRSC